VKKGLNFEIDKLTNSIENATTGEVFDTEVVCLMSNDNLSIKKSNWQFDWKTELNNSRKQVFKLNIVGNAHIIQGLMCIEDKSDHIFMHLVESAKFNKGKDKMYLGVLGNLVAYACKVSFEKGYDGYVAFDAKSALIKHYETTLHATHFRGLRMYIQTPAAFRLVNQYFNK
jgi:hypothetical protein